MGPLHILSVEKEGGIWYNIICLKLYQFERTTWWCLCVPEFVMESALIYPGICHDDFFFFNHGLSKFVSGPSLGGRLDENSGRP